MGELLRSHTELIDRIRLAFGLDLATFQSEVLPSVEAYARFVHLLPATPCAYFDHPGGLLELGLEVGFYALQGTDAHIFSGQSSISTRRVLEPRWRHATFLAGLCCELHRPLAALAVADATGNEWPAYRVPLADWLEAQRTVRYFVRWRPRSTEARGTALFGLLHLLKPTTLEYLDEGRSTIVAHLLASVAGVPVYREHNVLDGLVRRSLALVIEREVRAASEWHGADPFSPHLERYIVDELRCLAASEPSWRPNQDRSRVWWGTDGVFIAWPACAMDLRSRLERDGIAGVPKTPEGILNLLVATDIAQPCSAAEPTWLVSPQGIKAPVPAVKLASPSLLWDSDAAENLRLDRSLCVSPSSESPHPSPRPSPSPTPGRELGQLSLLEQGASSESLSPTGAQASPGNSTEPAPTARRRFMLQAPLRLNPLVRDGLASIIDTMNGLPHTAAAFIAANGIFVPLAELERRGVQPALALRSLGDVHLLVRDQASASPTLSYELAGTTQVGLVLDPRCVSGLALGAASAPASGSD